LLNHRKNFMNNRSSRRRLSTECGEKLYRSRRACLLKRVQWMYHLSYKKDSKHFAKVLKKTFECTKAPSSKLEGKLDEQGKSCVSKIVQSYGPAAPCRVHFRVARESFTPSMCLCVPRYVSIKLAMKGATGIRRCSETHV
jgi:hypothetical protein